MNRTKIFLLFIILAKFGIANSQTTKEFIVNEKALNKKQGNSTIIRIQAFDAENKKKFPVVIMKVDRVGFLQQDSIFPNFFLKKGRHKIQVGNVGYQDSHRLKLSVSPSKEYDIQVYLKPVTELLE